MPTRATALANPARTNFSGTALGQHAKADDPRQFTEEQS